MKPTSQLCGVGAASCCTSFGCLLASAHSASAALPHAQPLCSRYLNRQLSRDYQQCQVRVSAVSMGCMTVRSGSIVGAPHMHSPSDGICHRPSHNEGLAYCVSEFLPSKCPCYLCARYTGAWLGQKGPAQSCCLLQSTVQGISFLKPHLC